MKAMNPLKVLRSAVGKTVFVKLKDDTEYIGVLEQTDDTMNLVLRDCVEVANGTGDAKTKYGRVLIRGSNILYVSVDYENFAYK